MKPTLLAALTAALILTACGGGGSTPPANDTTAPTVSLSRSVSDDSSNVVLTAAATDDRRVTKVEFYQGSTLLTTDTTAPFTYSTDVTSPRTNFTARAYDAAGNVGTSAVFNIVTPYQGVWGWALVDSTDTIVDQGALINYDEVDSRYGLVSFGEYVNKAQTRSNSVLMGPLSGENTLDVAFTAAVTSSTVTFYFVGQDADNALGTFEGSATVEGSATTVDAAGNLLQTYGLAMVQTSTTVPPLGAQAAARQQAQSQAVTLATARPMTTQGMKANPVTLQDAATTILNR